MNTCQYFWSPAMSIAMRHRMLTDLWCRGLLALSVGRSGSGDVGQWGRSFRAVARGRGTRLGRDGRGGQVTNQTGAALHAHIGFALGSHVEHFEAVVVEARQLALKWPTAPFTTTDLYGSLAVEDGELPTCQWTTLHKYRSVQQLAHAMSPNKNTHTHTMSRSHTHAHWGVMEADNETHDKSVLILPEEVWTQ